MSTEAASSPEIAGADQGANQQQRQIEQAEPRNLLVLAIYEIVFRIAWIFKTESVIVPAFLDTLTGGAGGVRGWLPTLSRLGQSLPPLFVADQLRDAPSKGRVLRLTSLLLGVPTAAVAWIAWGADPQPAAWMPPAFLFLYVLFFTISGLNHVAQGTLHGKLIRADRRGRLMWISGTVGPVLAVAAAWSILGPWLDRPGISRFMPIFTFTAAGFTLCGFITLGLREPADQARAESRVPGWSQFKSAWWIWRSDRAFRRAARVAVLLTCIVLIFPHFQWLARVQLGIENRELMVWVVAQNVGIACFSPLCGWLGDRFGNRLVLRLQCLTLMFAPLLALLMAGPFGQQGAGRGLFWTVFLLLGMSPVAMRTLNNYTLELTTSELHPLYLSTMRVCYLMPFLFSPLAGMVLDLFADHPYTGASWLFGAVSGLIALAAILTFWMNEPRHALHSLLESDTGDEFTEE
ncbi:MAG: MFS transporter [Planctomycetaceae bacterium]